MPSLNRKVKTAFRDSVKPSVKVEEDDEEL